MSNESCSESLLDMTDCLTVDQRSIHKSNKKEQKIANYSKKLAHIHGLLQHTQATLTAYQEKAHKLKIKNKDMQTENSELRKKILLLEESQRLAKAAEVKSPSNTSLRTQETEWFLSNEASFSVSSCSSVDSIVILNDQVDFVKELKKTTPEPKAKTVHRVTSSAQSNSNMDKFIKQIRQKIYLGWNTPSIDTTNEISYLPGNHLSSRFLVSALLADVPILRF